jgi:hypothetical protein
MPRCVLGGLLIVGSLATLVLHEHAWRAQRAGWQHTGLHRKHPSPPAVPGGGSTEDGLLGESQPLPAPGGSAAPAEDEASKGPDARPLGRRMLYPLRLPRKATCIELDDVRAAHRRCGRTTQGTHADDLALPKASLACARSTETLCIQRSAPINPRCSATPESGVLGAVSWRAVAFGIAVHDSAAESRLLQAAADTWLQMTRGADLVLMTDADDARNTSSIAPRLNGQLRVHVYRCAECRGQPCPARARGQRAGSGCTGVRDGWLARRKVLHLFVAMAGLFGVGSAGGAGGAGGRSGVALVDGLASRASAATPQGSQSPRKEFFLKVDPDTAPVPHNVLRLLDELRSLLGQRQPFLFGMAACRVASFPLCHAAGGAGYGLSRPALAQLVRFLNVEYPRFLERVDKFTYGGEDVALAFALKKQTGTAVLNVGCMYQHAPLKYRKLHGLGENWVRWPLSSTPVSFHQIKDPDQMRAFFACALYDEHLQPRVYPRDLFAGYLNGTQVGRDDLREAGAHISEPCLPLSLPVVRHEVGVPRDVRLRDGGVVSIGRR